LQSKHRSKKINIKKDGLMLILFLLKKLIISSFYKFSLSNAIHRLSHKRIRDREILIFTRI